MPDFPNHRPPRIPGYDYSTPGAYFVTLCLNQRHPLFGTVRDATVYLTPAGIMVEHAWRNIDAATPGVEARDLVVMPDHLHGILWITQNNDTLAITLAAVMQRFKTFTTTRYIRGVRTLGWPAFSHHLWQRSYYDHVIRSEDDLARIRTYIQDNPIRWAATHPCSDIERRARPTT